MNNKRYAIFVLLLCFFFPKILGQEKFQNDNIYQVSINDTSIQKDYHFTLEKIIPSTSVKNQCMSSTCWCFSALSVLESEILTRKKENIDLSPMYVVRQSYIDRAIQYVRMHGYVHFSGSGLNYDVIDAIKKNGIVPQSVYPGLHGKVCYDHTEMDSVLYSYIQSVIKYSLLNPKWLNRFKNLLDYYLGTPPDSFIFNATWYTPKTFLKYLDLHLDDYVVLTSFLHHPYYEHFVLEVPDNWAFGEAYNLPLSELQSLIDSAIMHNYTIGWSADVTEKGFQFYKGVAVIPDLNELTDADSLWQNAYHFPSKELTITPELRQMQFDNYSTTDDHGMQIVGLAKDQTGKRFYYVKNSWGINSKYNGYLYVSENYLKLKTTSIMVNKNAIPLVILAKLKK